MATQRVVPGTNLPESGSSTVGKGRSGADLGQTAGPIGSDINSELPGETGLGSGPALSTSGFGDNDTFGTSGLSTEAFGQLATERATREFPRAAGVIDQVKQQASTRVNEQKTRAAEGLGSVASAIRQASDHLRTENQTLANYADKAVDQIQLFADRMRDKDPAEMMRDAERFARRNPAAFVGGAFVLGVALARFLKSSSDATNDSRSFMHRDSDFGDTGSTGYGGYGSYRSYGSDSRAGAGFTNDPASGISS